MIRIDKSDPSFQGLVLAHGRELVQQIYDVMQSLNVHMGLDIKMIKKEDKKPSMGQITVCVLGKAQALVKQKKMKVDNLKVVVMDEADVFF